MPERSRGLDQGVRSLAGCLQVAGLAPLLATQPVSPPLDRTLLGSTFLALL